MNYITSLILQTTLSEGDYLYSHSTERENEAKGVSVIAPRSHHQEVAQPPKHIIRKLPNQTRAQIF